LADGACALEMLVSMRPEPDFWHGKRVLLSGHTGFKGAWLALWLQRLGARVTGIALPPATEPSLFALAQVEQGIESHFCDVRDAQALADGVRAARPEIVLHLAAQALVRPSYAAPLETFATNVMGTAHLLDALRGLPGVRVAVVVTPDQVDRNREWAYPYREDDALGGHDPYSASKAAAELVTASYRDAFLAAQGVAVATARAGNVIGGGDWADDRLLPDAVRAWQAGQTLHIRRPQSTRPWQHVLEPLAAYLCLAQSLWEQSALAGAYNFGPLPHEAATVENVIKLASIAYPSSAISYENNSDGPHEAGWLTLETAHARQTLGVAPRWPLGTAVARTMDWYRRQHGGADARALCLADIAAWEAQA
jgi:CDP-glucose 4,6-dehydratase